MDIESLKNPKVQEAVKLFSRRQRDKRQKFLIEGYRELLRAHEGGERLEHLFYCESLFLGRNEMRLLESFDCPCYRVSEKVFGKLSYRDRPDGLLGVGFQRHRMFTDAMPLGGTFYVACEALEKPGNLGTLLRSSDAAGTDGFIVCDRTTDIHNPNVVRSSTGTLFTQDVFEATTSDLIEVCRSQNLMLVAATPHAHRVYTEVDLTSPLVIVLGTEQLGLSKEVMEAASVQVKIPMHGMADSLNVATAGTLMLFEVVRQRRGS